ncbi:MAG: hypothetical protein PHV30_00585 [Candidatus Margulisbacteria bacterium]|nr:hypothetical protein [Candidatus Margulisiibacteriota bacterium]
MHRYFLGLLIILFQVITLSFISEPDINTTRARGMSNAFVGLANDEGALFYNPAGLHFIDTEIYNSETDVMKLLEEPTKQHMNASLDFFFNLGYFNAMQYIQNNKSTGPQMIQFNTGLEKKAYAKRALNFSLFSPDNGLSLYAVEDMQYIFQTTGVKANKDTHFMAIYGKSFEMGPFALGLSGRGELLSRMYNNMTYAQINSNNIQNAIDFENTIFSDQNSASIMNGVGFAGNIGIMTEWNNVRLGLAMENFIASNINLQPIKGNVSQNLIANEDWALQNLRAGLSYSDGDLVLAFDIHNLNRTSKEMSYHLGMEKDLINFWILPKLRLRAGASLSEQYFGYSAGVAFRVWVLQINMSYLENRLNIDKVNDSTLTSSLDQQANINIEFSF